MISSFLFRYSIAFIAVLGAMSSTEAGVYIYGATNREFGVGYRDRAVGVYSGLTYSSSYECLYRETKGYWGTDYLIRIVPSIGGTFYRECGSFDLCFDLNASMYEYIDGGLDFGDFRVGLACGLEKRFLERFSVNGECRVNYRHFINQQSESIFAFSRNAYLSSTITVKYFFRSRG